MAGGTRSLSIPDRETDKELQRRSLSGGAGQLILLAVLFFGTALGNNPISFSLGLFGLVVIANLMRIGLGLVDGTHQYFSRARWRQLYAASIFLSGAAWGAIFSATIRQYGLSSYATGLSFLVGSGLCAAITSSLSPWAWLALTFAALVLGIPFVTVVALREYPPAIIFLTYYIYLLAQLRVQSETYWSGVHAREDKKAEREHLQQVSDTTPGVVAWLSFDLAIHGVNKSFSDKHGGVPADYIGKRFGFRMEETNPLPRLVEEFARQDTSQSIHELQLFIGGAPRWHLAVLRKAYASQEIYLIAIDIQELKNAQAQLEAQRNKAEMASKLAALGEVSSGIAHEIKNPLTAVKTSLELILHKAASHPTSESELISTVAAKAIAACEHIEEIATGLTRFARKTDNEPFTRARVDQLVKDAFELVIQQYRSAQVRLRVEDAVNETVEIDCRPVEIVQVLVNLLVNSLDAVRSAPAKTDRWVQVRYGTAPSDQVEISVSDSGTGIAADAQPNLFTPFFTTKPPGKGTGLGLSVSRSIIVRHGGILDYVPEAPNTTFRLSLPRAKRLTDAEVLKPAS